jgi:hypothetical protein
MFLKKRIEKSKSEIKKTMYDLNTTTPMYKIDLNNDKHKEGILYHKDNGKEKLNIFSYENKLIKSFELDIFGKNAALQRVLIKSLSSNLRTIILYFYAGEQEYLEFQSQGRLYFINIDNGNLQDMKIFKGPSFWSESKDTYGNYYRRHYNLELNDLNNDGIKEVIVKYSILSNVCYYLGDGDWKCI